MSGNPNPRFPPRAIPVNRCLTPNIHDMLRKEIYSQDKEPDNPNVDGGNAPTGSGSLQTPMNIAQSFVDYELFFDSLYTDLTSPLLTGQISFSVVNLNSFNPLQNIIEARVGNFYFPNIITTGNTDYFYYRRVYLKIAGTTQQSSVQAANGFTYHFEFDIQNLSSTSLQLLPVKEVYYFQIPLTSINTITFNWYSPLGTQGFVPIPIPSSKVLVQAVAGANPGGFTIITGATNGTADIAPIGAIAPPGIAVFFSNFTSDDPVANASVNAPTGIYATNILSITSFQVNVSFAGVATSTPTYMVIGKNRIAFPMRFTCLSPTQNGVIAAHL